LQADYTDAKALAEIASRCAAATTEFENVPAESLHRLSEKCVVSPAASSVAVAQDRIREKLFLRDQGFATAPFAVVKSESDLRVPEIDSLLPGVRSRDELNDAFRALRGESCVLEKFLALQKEVSVVVVRGFDNAVVTFPVAENEHAHGILDVSIVPARVASNTANEARALAIDLANKLDYRGVLCVEYFVLDDGQLLVNEIAPRPHNSGHYSIDACVTSQFEQQVRVMCSLPLGDTSMHTAAVMLNLLGDLWANGEPRWETVLSHSGAKLHLYGKSEPRPGRKMGHVTVLSRQIDAALGSALQIKSTLASNAAHAQARSA
jgi:5-(carboxyamino)imidazole ribonucleotide synthase